MESTVIAAFIFLIISTAIVLISAWFVVGAETSSRPLNFVFCTTAALLGYGYGILRFPLNNDETTDFQKIETGLALVASGYFAGKLDVLLTPMFKGEKNSIFVFRFLTAIASFVIALIATFMARRCYIGNC